MEPNNTEMNANSFWMAKYGKQNLFFPFRFFFYFFIIVINARETGCTAQTPVRHASHLHHLSVSLSPFPFLLLMTDERDK